MVPCRPSYAQGASDDGLILLTLLNSIRCSEFDDRRKLKLSHIHWGFTRVFVHLQNSNHGNGVLGAWSLDLGSELQGSLPSRQFRVRFTIASCLNWEILWLQLAKGVLECCSQSSAKYLFYILDGLLSEKSFGSNVQMRWEAGGQTWFQSGSLQPNQWPVRIYPLEFICGVWTLFRSIEDAKAKWSWAY